MRKHIQTVLRGYFGVQINRTRDRLGISQEEMAHQFGLNTRSYIDSEHGKSCCSAATLVFYLLYMCPDSEAFLEQLRHELEKQRTAA